MPRSEKLNLPLRCFVVIELKAGKSLPEYAGKLNFYLSAVDSKLKHKTDSPSIGIILCRLKDKIEVEYALRDLNKPIGISSFELSEIIPDDLKSQLPTIEEMERELIDE
ncbi:PDDEXK nuclease domain-containing protein [Chitinophaga jiangningensis]|uniref:PDDEXK nuclease domain-containing protein n=1 Tax=Chitinophaga jiangningensis TaxID=1419482 RepID=UPI001C4A59CF|nr:PDDEXK nuclease domain-containing protein [Chitinophaga jiangningensis]